MLDKKNMPRHIAIVMDGNGRWAKKRGLPRVIGHNAGMKAMKEIVRTSSDIGIKYLTVYAFSTENWKRSKDEVGGIFKLLIKYVQKDLRELCSNNVKVNIIGDYEKFPKEVKEALYKVIEDTRANKGLEFNIALNYGSRDEITEGLRNIIQDVSEGKISIENIGETEISSSLYTGQLNIPDPDFVIRTSGEERLSNFLLWQSAYSELYFTKVLWPDFTPECYLEAIEEYQNRNRRFGGR